ncbi:hypothetical protein Ancab_012233, partial [Ancistrocladus abbreviatus]
QVERECETVFLRDGKWRIKMRHWGDEAVIGEDGLTLHLKEIQPILVVMMHVRMRQCVGFRFYRHLKDISLVSVTPVTSMPLSACMGGDIELGRAGRRRSLAKGKVCCSIFVVAVQISETEDELSWDTKA